jgi:RNA polymerase-binding transcription factor DksA
MLEEQWRNQLAQITALSLHVIDSAGHEAGDDDVRTEYLRINAQLIAAARRQLEDTEAALQRLDDGEYGSCAQCGQPIPAERLEILPAAKFCIGCQRLIPGRR